MPDEPTIDPALGDDAEETQTVASTTGEPPQSDDSDTETLFLELDPARTMMYRLAREAGGEQVDAILAEQLESAVEQLYDSREQLAAERAAREQQQAHESVAHEHVEE